MSRAKEEHEVAAEARVACLANQNKVTKTSCVLIGQANEVFVAPSGRCNKSLDTIFKILMRTVFKYNKHARNINYKYKI